MRERIPVGTEEERSNDPRTVPPPHPQHVSTIRRNWKMTIERIEFGTNNDLCEPY